MSEFSVNRLLNGVHKDNHPTRQPQDSLRDSVNGIIEGSEDGSYHWRAIDGTKVSFTFSGAWLLGAEQIDNFIFVISLNAGNTTVYFDKVTISKETYTGTTVQLYSASNSILSMAQLYPVRRILGFKESDAIFRIYWTDGFNKPRSMNILDPDLATLDPKMLDFVVDTNTSNIALDDVPTGGSVKNGTYFFICQLYSSSGAYTPWSVISEPITVAPSVQVSNFDADDYQEHQGGSSDNLSTKKISVSISDIDTDFDYINVAVFYSSSYNVVETGFIFLKTAITGSSMTVEYLGSEFIESILMEDIITQSIVIMSCQDMDVMKNTLDVANIIERGDLDLPDTLSGISIAAGGLRLPLDTTILPTKENWSVKSLFGHENSIGKSAVTGIIVTKANPAVFTKTAHGFKEGDHLFFYNFSEMTELDYETYVVYDETANTFRVRLILHSSGTTAPYLDSSSYGSAETTGGNAMKHPLNVLPDVYYKATSSVQIMNTSGSTSNYSTGDVFWSSNSPAILVSGTIIPAIRKVKYSIVAGGYAYDDVDLTTSEYLDYKNPKISHYLSGYPRGQKIRLGIVFTKNGYPYKVRMLGDYTVPNANLVSNVTTMTYSGNDSRNTYSCYTNSTIVGLLVSGIDVTDIRDDIDGFYIVRAVYPKKKISSGILAHLNYGNGGSDNNVELHRGLKNFSSDSEREPNTYTYYSPEHLLNDPEFSIQKGDKLYLRTHLFPQKRYHTSDLGQGYGIDESDNENTYYKLYEEVTSGGGTHHSNSVVGVTNEIEEWFELNIEDSGISYRQSNISKLIYNHHDDGGVAFGRGSKSMMLITKNNEDVSGGYENSIIGYNIVDASPSTVLVDHIRDVPDYGSHENTVYIPTGHYQKVDASVLSDINNGGSYVFDNIQVFGGGYYINLFDMNRMYDDRNESDHYGQAVVFPVESEMNIALRTGDHVAKDRNYDATDNTSGIRYQSGFVKLEEFNYEDSYSTKDIGYFFPSLPSDFDINTYFPATHRWSERKVINDKIDSFRIFPANNFKTVNLNKGAIINVRILYNRLIYWQERGIGYMPYNERALLNDQFGQPVQLGIGGEFDTFSEIEEEVGNQHHFGLTKTDYGFVWFDARRKLFIHMFENYRIMPESLIKGMDSWFEEYVQTEYLANDNPLYFGGIVSSYDPKTRMVFMNFVQYGNPVQNLHYSVGYNAMRKNFTGTYTYAPGFMMYFDNRLYSNFFSSSTVLVHDEGGKVEFTDSATNHASVTIVINDKYQLDKIWDNLIVLASENYFSYLKFESSFENITENVISATGVNLLPKYYKYLKHKWHSSIPRISSKRISDDGYLLLTLGINYDRVNKDVRLLEVITKYRRML